MRADIERMLSTGRLSATDGHLMLTALAQADSRISAGVHAAAPQTVTVAPTPVKPPKPKAKPGPAPHGHDHHGPGPGGHGGGD